MADYNHREMVDGKGGDLILHQKIWQELQLTKDELVGRQFGERWSQMPALPEVEIFWSKPEEAELVLVKEGRLYCSDLEFKRLSLLANLPASVCFPSFRDNDLLFTYLGSRSAVMLAQEDGLVYSLTSLPAQYANWHGSEVVYQVEDRLVRHNLKNGQISSLVQGIELNSPPRGIGGSLYFLVEDKLYRINPRMKEKRLSELIPLEQGVQAFSEWLGYPVAFVGSEDSFQLIWLTGSRRIKLNLAPGKYSHAFWAGEELRIEIEQLTQVRQIIWHKGYLYLALERGGRPWVLALRLGEYLTSLTSSAEEVARSMGYTLGFEPQPKPVELLWLEGAYDLAAKRF